MTALELFHYEYGKDMMCPLTKLPLHCPKEYGYLPDAEWCSEGANNEDCAKSVSYTHLDVYKRQC